jgi:CDP-diacylglycerol--serine O-phosphatidyltransferase
MALKKHLPNLITLLNLLSGCIAVLYAVFGYLEAAALFVAIGIGFDFFDGFAARLLKVEGALGKQLDSLADMVTSGLVPGIVMMQMLLKASTENTLESLLVAATFQWLPFCGLLVTLASAYRLANFNIDTRQTSSFVGLPTPANTLLIVSLPLICKHSEFTFVVALLQNKYLLLVLTFVSVYLLNAEIPLFALKFKNFSWKDNAFKFLFLGLSLLLLLLLQFVAVPLIVLLYVTISVWQHFRGINASD